MIEAVNAAISSAITLRNATDQIDVIARANVYDVAPYADSLNIHVDLDYDKAVLQVLDGSTGDVLSQYPSQETLAGRQRAEAAANELAQEINQPVAEAPSASTSTQISSATGNINAPVSAAPEASSPASHQASPFSVPEAQIAAAALSSAATGGSHSGETVSLSA